MRTNIVTRKIRLRVKNVILINTEKTAGDRMPAVFLYYRVFSIAASA